MQAERFDDPGLLGCARHEYFADRDVRRSRGELGGVEFEKRLNVHSANMRFAQEQLVQPVGRPHPVGEGRVRTNRRPLPRSSSIRESDCCFPGFARERRHVPARTPEQELLRLHRGDRGGQQATPPGSNKVHASGPACRMAKTCLRRAFTNRCHHCLLSPGTKHTNQAYANSCLRRFDPTEMLAKPRPRDAKLRKGSWHP